MLVLLAACGRSAPPPAPAVDAHAAILTPLPITLDGQPLPSLAPSLDDETTIASAAPTDRAPARQQQAGGQHHRLGQSLRGAIAAAGIDVAALAAVVLQAGDPRTATALDAAWWRDATHDVRLRTNRRGLWRAALVDGRGETTKLADLRSIELTRQP